MAHLALRRWGVRHLVLAWCVYWLALVLVVFGPPALLTWRLTHDPDGHGRVSASANNDVLSLTVAEDGVVRWAGSASVLTLALWLAGPPLLLYAVWLASRPGRVVGPRVGGGTVR